MKLKEIEMDLQYVKNEELIRQIQTEEGLMYEEAVRRDYEANWKDMRRNFQLMTRCMTAMLERIMVPIDTADCKKIIFECVNDSISDTYKNVLGVYIVQVPFDISSFFEMSDYDKKKMTVQTMIEGTKKLSNQVTFQTDNIFYACTQIIQSDYVNEWMWKKSLKMRNQVVRIKVQHEVDDVSIFMVFINKDNLASKQILLVKTLADERAYDMYLGKLEKISEKEVALFTKTGEQFLQTCDY